MFWQKCLSLSTKITTIQKNRSAQRGSRSGSVSMENRSIWLFRSDKPGFGKLAGHKGLHFQQEKIPYGVYGRKFEPLRWFAARHLGEYSSHNLVQPADFVIFHKKIVKKSIKFGNFDKKFSKIYKNKRKLPYFLVIFAKNYDFLALC